MARARGTSRSSSGTAAGRLLSGALWAALGGGLLWFAVAGGEYGPLDLLQQAAHRDSVAAEVAALQRQRDSLVRALQALRTDPERLERVAREEHGMVRGDNELLYRLSRGSAPRVDSGRAAPDIP